MSETERRQLLVEWNEGTADDAADLCVHQLFEAQVERTPDAVALVSEEKQLTYRELNCRANRLAHHLRALGVGPEMLVAICLERSAEMVIALLAILKAGGAYLPLDPAYPKERLAFMMKDARPPVLLTRAGLMAGWTEAGCEQSSVSIQTGKRSPAKVRTIPPTRSAPITSPMSSTRRDRPGSPKAFSFRMARSRGIAATLNAVTR